LHIFATVVFSGLVITTTFAMFIVPERNVIQIFPAKMQIQGNRRNGDTVNQKYC
jgi:hypothetical protein